ncbi:unnamed protein product [Paramecium primaurelia]|uniref:Uncharacterized protein n=1 Tax=Paramecium primaurelia TaxID=5886 RepID=A0A8S1PMS7_PARPR|nr:unnamed protein product [Paramecium primaurelia]
MPYLLDPILSATEYQRPKQSGPDIVHHWGIVVTNKSGSYLVHNMPETGTVATPVSNMSNNWKPYQNLKVGDNKTIQGMFQSTGPAAYFPQGFDKYITQGTCLGATELMKLYLAW